MVRSSIGRLGLCVLLVAGFGARVRAAKIEVHGAGLVRDRELSLALNRLLDTKSKPALDANAIEDAAVIAQSSLGEQGFQHPAIKIEAKLPGGDERRLVFDPTFANPLPRTLRAETVKFHLEPGIRSHIETVEFTGLTAVPLKTARSYFRTENTLLFTARANAYSPARVNRGVNSLLNELRQRGYGEAQVRAGKVGEQDGAVALRVEVQEGVRTLVSGVRFQRDEGDPVVLPDPHGWIGQPWTPTLEQDAREAVRHAYYESGFPDVGVNVAPEGEVQDDGVRHAEMVVTIVPGPKVVVGQVRFEGNTITRESVLRRRVEPGPGDPLDPIALERARYRISRLGVFESVDLRYEPPEGPTRNPVFTVREGPRYATSLLFGYGSYEQLRGGVEYRQMNVLGLAHQSRLELIQSMKSTSGDYSYTVPELFGESIDGTAKLFGLQRKEIAFIRQEYGADFTLQRAVAPLHGDARLGYTFQALRNRRNGLATQATDEKQVNAASMTFALTGDTRDNPLVPRHGYHWSAEAEVAHPYFGGAATYQRVELAGAFHTSWGQGRWIHVGFSHGFITTSGADDDRTLPVNKRFFPGGDNSIRGYQRGEASPRGADGRFVGAKTYLLLNLELEQALTHSWSVVAFGDALGTAEFLRDYPFRERLYSVGLGLRYQTLIGPVRLEYGRNINPRPADPPGTWQISIGYPF